MCAYNTAASEIRSMAVAICFVQSSFLSRESTCHICDYPNPNPNLSINSRTRAKCGQVTIFPSVSDDLCLLVSFWYSRSRFKNAICEYMHNKERFRNAGKRA